MSALTPLLASNLDCPYDLRWRSPAASILPARVLPWSHIELQEEADSLEALFTAVAHKLAGPDRPRPDQVVRALWRRHGDSSPSLGSGLALARAAVPRITRPLAVYQRLRSPVRLMKHDACRTTDCLTLLVPRPGLMADHELLVSVTAFMSLASTVQALRACSSESEIRLLFTDQA